MKSQITTFCVCSALVFGCQLDLAAQALPNLADEMKLKGQAIAQYLKEIENVQSCGIGSFTGPKQSPASGIGEMLRAELESHGIKIVGSGDAKYFLNGRCRIDDDGFGSHELIIDIEILDDLGSTVKNLPTKVELPDGKSVALAVNNKISVKTTKADDIAKVVLVSTSLTEINEANEPPTTKERRKVNKIIKSIKKPTTHVAGTRIKTDPSSPYAVEVSVNGTIRAPEKHEGFYYAPMHRDDTCSLKFYNDSDHSVYIQVFVDGINSFHFADDHRVRNQGYKISKHTSGEILGWYKNNEKVTEFRITPHPQSALAKNAASGNQNDATQEGIIAVAIHRWFEPGEAPKLQGKGNGKPDAMGFGRDIKQKSKSVKGHVGQLQEIVAIRYRR